MVKFLTQKERVKEITQYADHVKRNVKNMVNIIPEDDEALFVLMESMKNLATYSSRHLEKLKQTNDNIIITSISRKTTTSL